MEKLLDEIDKRVHLPENEEKYHQLWLHTSEVAGGKEFIEHFNRAVSLLKTMDENTNPRLTYAPQYRHIIQDMTEWLDNNGWAK